MQNVTEFFYQLIMWQQKHVIEIHIWFIIILVVIAIIFKAMHKK